MDVGRKFVIADGALVEVDSTSVEELDGLLVIPAIAELRARKRV